MKVKIHGAVVVLFVLAGICYAASWMGAAMAIGLIGVVLELAAWLVRADKSRDEA